MTDDSLEEENKRLRIAVELLEPFCTSADFWNQLYKFIDYGIVHPDLQKEIEEMTVGITKSLSESIQWFCEDEIEIGDPLYGDCNDEPMVARSFKNRKPSDKLLGVSTVLVATIDLTKYHHHAYSNVVNTGHKIMILQDGEICIRRKYDKIPCGQPMYVSKKGKITWKKHCDHIGRASSKQDKDGFLKVRIKIND